MRRCSDADTISDERLSIGIFMLFHIEQRVRYHGFKCAQSLAIAGLGNFPLQGSTGTDKCQVMDANFGLSQPAALANLFQRLLDLVMSESLGHGDPQMLHAPASP